MANEHGNLIQDVGGDGRPADVSHDELSQLKEEMRLICVQSLQIAQQRLSDDAVRFSFWDGQSDDGRKHEADLGRKPMPFEGGSDARVRMVDGTIRKCAARLSQAVKRAAIHFEETGSGDRTLPGKLDATLRWIRDIQWGSAHHNEVRKAANYFFSDTPAGVVWYVGWDRHTCLRMTTIRLADVAAFLLGKFSQEDVAPTAADVALVQGMFENKELEDDAVDLLAQILPHIKAPTLRAMVKQIREEGEAELPEPYEASNLPILWALRPQEDVFFPVNTIRNINNARAVYVREWLTASQVRERAIGQGWDESFVEALLGKPDEGNPTTGGGAAGQSGLPLPNGTIQQQQTPLAQNLGLYRDFRHLYEVVTAWTRGMDGNGIPGIYVYTFSYFVDQAAKPRELYRSGHGKLPFVWCQREMVNSMLTDSRSLSYLGMSTQRMLKTLTDLEIDGAQIGTLPPLDVPQNTQDNQVVIQPLALNRRVGREGAKFMEMPQRPIANVEMRDQLERMWRDYVGQAHEGVDPMEAALLQQEDIDVFLSAYRDAMVMCMQDSQLFLTDEQVQQIQGPGSTPVAQSLEEIQGKFGLNMVCDAIDFNIEQLVKFCEIFFKFILPLDTGQTIKRNVVVRWLFNKLNPSMARAAVIPEEQANQHEIEEEDEVIVKALMGMDSPMMEEGQNHALRLQRLQEQLQKPGVNQRLLASPDAQEILNRRVQHLTQMVTQEQNKVIGRLGAVPGS